MIWATTGITFLAAVMISLILAYALAPPARPQLERLSKLTASPGPSSVEERFGGRHRQRVERVLADLGKLLPTSERNLTRTQRLMIRAGFRQPEADRVLQGAKMLLPVCLMALIYFTGAYKSTGFFPLVLIALFGFLAPDFWLTWRIQRRQHNLVMALPNALDLLVICVEAGLGLDQGLLRVSQELRIIHPELSEELQLVNLEMRVGKGRVDALQDVAVRTGVEDIKALVNTLVQTDRFGTDLAQALRVHAESLRTKRRQRVEEAAAKLTVKMLPPLVFLVFPPLFIVLLAPAVITLVRELLPALSR